MKPSLLDILAEPTTGAALELHRAQEKDGRIVEGELRAAGSGRVYPIVRGIPRFVPDSGYSASFGMQWNRFREVQVDSSRGDARSRQRFDDETGWTASMLEGKWCLDGGCGAGRFAEIAASRKCELVGLDLSSAIDATAETCRKFDNVQLVQGSLLDPPFKRGAFDFAYSIGVIQHTPNPDLAVRKLVECVRPGGRFTVTIYARRPWTKLHSKYLLRPFTKRLPQEWLLNGIRAAMPVAFPATDVLFRLPGVGKIAQFTIPVANYVDRRDLSRDDRYQEAILDTFDMLSPAYDLPMTWQEVEVQLREAHAQQWTFKTRVPIVCEGQR